jgi:RNA polymerase primary sigma factor
MNLTLSQPFSPLEQLRKGSRAAGRAAKWQLSAKDEQAMKLILESDYEFVDHESFHKPDASVQIFDKAPAIRQPDTSWYHPLVDSVTDATSMNSVGRVLLTGAEERALFLQFNYSRFMVTQIKAELGDKPLDKSTAEKLLHWHHKAEAYRDQIAQTNLALVLAMAKRTRMTEVDFGELVSEGNMALLRAIDKFDAARGFKFSTYACRAIIKGFSRLGMKQSKIRSMFPTDFDTKLERSDYLEKRRDTHESDCVEEIRDIIRENRAELSQIEQEVIEHRFGVGNHGAQHDGTALTLDQVGKLIGVTKERVRQIQNKAMEKIRNTLESDFLR